MWYNLLVFPCIVSASILQDAQAEPNGGLDPTSSVVACSDTASCARLCAVNRCISGTRPTVDTVTCAATAAAAIASNSRRSLGCNRDQRVACSSE